MPILNQTILVVEDEPDTAEMLSEMVRLCGYKVINSYAGQSALSLIANSQIDAIVLDMILPGVSGLDILKFVKRDPRLRHIPVIIVTANSLYSDRQICLEAGANDYLTKPVGFEEFSEVIGRSLHPASKPL
jgi:CheY-like chemotaxis protein